MYPFTEEDFDPYRALAVAALPYTLPLARTKARALSLSERFASLLLFGGGLFFLWRSGQFTSSSFKQSLYLELSSGLWFFWAAPYVLAVGRRHRLVAPVGGIAIGGLLLREGAQLGGFPQSALIEFGIAIFLLVGLDLALSPWLKALAEASSKAAAAVEALKELDE